MREVGAGDCEGEEELEVGKGLGEGGQDDVGPE